MVTLTLLGLLVVAILAALFIRQEPTEALVREPGERKYGPAVPVAEVARTRWELALLSHQVYERGRNPEAKPES